MRGSVLNMNYAELPRNAVPHRVGSEFYTAVPRDDQGLELLEQLFGAIAQPRRWPSVVNHVAASLGISLSAGPIIASSNSGERKNICDDCAAVMNRFRNLAAADTNRNGHSQLRSVCRQLEKATAICCRISMLETQRAAPLQALDRLDRGLLLMDRDSKVIVGNSVAWDILKQGDGLYLEFDGLRTSQPQESVLLRQMIRKAATAATEDKPFDSVLTVTRPSLRRALTLVITSIFQSAGCPARQEAATVFVCDPERKLHIDPSSLSRVYGLTKSEAGICVKLLEGESLETAADQLCISIDTARTHLKRIFLKTSTHRQPQLVALVLNNRL